MRLIYLFLFCTVKSIAMAQNLGVGTNMPAAQLHVKSSDIEVMRLEAQHPYLNFYSRNSHKAYVGFDSTNNRMEIGSVLGTGAAVVINPGYPSAWFTSFGRLGLGVSNPLETLDVYGSINLRNSLKGVVLDAADQPLITRGFDVFSTGKYTGLGRWGLFMEPSRLTLGIPNVLGKGFAVSSYNTNSTIAKNLLLVTQDGTTSLDGELNRPSKTGNANLVPIAFGSVNGSTGAIKTGSGNFTVTHTTSGGGVVIQIAGETYTPETHIVTVTAQGLSARIASVAQDNFFMTNGFRVIFWNTDGYGFDTDFSFVVYKP